MDPVVMAAGTALIGAMATDVWQQARTAVVRLWRRTGSGRADAVENELDEVRAQVLAARADGDEDTEQALAGVWRLRLQELVRQDPSLAADLRRVLDEELLPALGTEEKERARTIVMYGSASGHGRVYQAGGDQHIR